MKVLVIDDSSTTRRIESTYLQQAGITDIIQAVDGLDGLEKLENNMPIDFILLDINMPNLDGMDTLRRIREKSEYALVKVVMVSSDNEKLKIIEAFNLGADDYIPKPFSFEQFKQKIAKIIGVKID